MRVLVTRDESEAAPYLDYIATLGGRGFACPLFTVHAVARQAPDLRGIRSLVFTSRYGIRHFCALTPRRDLPVFVVGNQSAEEAQAQGFSIVHNARGTGEELAALIKPEDGPLFYGRARHISFPVCDRLAQRGIEAREEILYETRPIADPALPDGYDLALFFSARGAAIFTEYVEKQGVADRLRQTKALCLGAGMVESLSILPWHSITVTATPDREGMLTLIKENIIKAG